MTYAGGLPSACVFCEIVAGRTACAKVAEDAMTFAFMDIDPGAEGHVLVVPRRHSTDLFDISADDLAATALSAQRVARAAMSALRAEGVNLFNCSRTAAWQSVFHFHMHVIPRYSDGNRDRINLLYEPGTPADLAALAEQAQLLAARY